jgi:peptidoglycan/LPS O-acetylase OafA/YrhL
VTAVAGALSSRPPLSEALTAPRLNDLGNLLLTFVMLWAYVAFSQYLIIWSGDLPRETSWVLNRTRPGWDKVALILIFFHFAVPFLLLLFRRVKRSRAALAAVAGGLVAIHALDVFWRVRPSSEPGALAFHWPDATAPLALGGFWVGAYLFQLRRHPPRPLPQVRHA